MIQTGIGSALSASAARLVLLLGGHEKPPVEETWVQPGPSAKVHSP